MTDPCQHLLTSYYLVCWQITYQLEFWQKFDISRQKNDTTIRVTPYFYYWLWIDYASLFIEKKG